jgi:hypothetical protein
MFLVRRLPDPPCRPGCFAQGQSPFRFSCSATFSSDGKKVATLWQHFDSFFGFDPPAFFPGFLVPTLRVGTFFVPLRGALKVVFESAALRPRRRPSPFRVDQCLQWSNLSRLSAQFAR